MWAVAPLIGEVGEDHGVLLAVHLYRSDTRSNASRRSRRLDAAGGAWIAAGSTADQMPNVLQQGHQSDDRQDHDRASS
jgi:hypothetical protein